MPREFYRLTADVKNPAPDRRSKDPTRLPAWPAGTVFMLVKGADPTVGWLQFVTVPGASFRYSGTFPVHTDEAKAILSAPREAEKLNLKLMEKKYQVGPEYWLAVLVETGKVTIEDLEKVAAAIDDAEEDSEADQAFNQMFRNQGV